MMGEKKAIITGKQSPDYAKWAQSEDRFWGNMRRREGFGLLAMALFVIIWLVFDLPKHLFQ